MERIEKTIGLADLHGTVATITCEPPDGEFKTFAQLELKTGGARLSASPTVEAWRQLAAAALDVADALEEEMRGG